MSLLATTEQDPSHEPEPALQTHTAISFFKNHKNSRNLFFDCHCFGTHEHEALNSILKLQKRNDGDYPACSSQRGIRDPDREECKMITITVDLPRSCFTSSSLFNLRNPQEVEGSSLQSTIQKKLEELATTPRKEFSLNDINKKLDEANKRKQDNLVSSKAVTHNAKLLTVYEKTKEEETEKIKALEEHISSKLANAEALKDDKTKSWMKKLSRSTKEKLRRGAKVKHNQEWSAKELETKIEIKALAADLRREELKLKVQEDLAASNQDKLRRAQLALDMANAEAKHIELRSDLKLISAEQRREMNNALALTRMGEAAAEKRDKVDDLRKQEEEDAKRSLAEIEEKIRRADERKQQAVAEMVESIALLTSEKLQRASAVCKKEEELAKAKSMQIAEKVELANHRRDTLIREQEASHKLASKKEGMFRRKEKEEELASESKGKEIQMKLISATERKENILANKVQAVKDDHQAKETRARETMLEALNESKELKKKSDKRLKKAAKRKQQVSRIHRGHAAPNYIISF